MHSKALRNGSQKERVPERVPFLEERGRNGSLRFEKERGRNGWSIFPERKKERMCSFFRSFFHEKLTFGLVFLFNSIYFYKMKLFYLPFKTLEMIFAQKCEAHC